MLVISSYKFNKTYRFCIYIQPRLYAFLRHNCRGNVSNFLEYLIQKYEQGLILQKKTNLLKNASCQYQPKTRDYKRIILRKLNPEIWKKLKEIKSFTGCSISYLIRLMLEWEMESKGYPVNPLERLMINHRQQFNYPNFFLSLNNYEHQQWWDRASNAIFSIFWDFP